MKNERKLLLLNNFPPVPDNLTETMLNGKGAENFCVFLTYGQELYVRCFHRYSNGNEIIERQRYVFAKDGSVRYGSDYGTVWKVRKDFREPVFCHRLYGRAFDNRYRVLNFDAVFKSDMKYSQISKDECLPISYLHLYCRHPNIEYIVKSGYGHLIRTEIYGTEIYGYLKTRKRLIVSEDIEWKSNNLLKMLHLNRNEFKALKGNEGLYEDFILHRERYPKYKADEILMISKAFRSEVGTINHCENATGYSAKKIAGYLCSQNIPLHNYKDYLEQCKHFRYNLHDTAICFPHDFNAMHTRLSQIIEYKANAEMREEFNRHIEERVKFEFKYKNLILIQPTSPNDIISEGKALAHCVGGYTKRHSEGSTNIMFLRKNSEPDKPYFTVEVSNDYRIIQCHGYRNDKNGKPQEITEFEEQYQKYLEGLKNAGNDNQQRVQVCCGA